MSRVSLLSFKDFYFQKTYDKRNSSLISHLTICLPIVSPVWNTNKQIESLDKQSDNCGMLQIFKFFNAGITQGQCREIWGITYVPSKVSIFQSMSVKEIMFQW